MQPWIVSSPALQVLLRQLGRDFASAGHNLWDMIGREEPFAAETAPGTFIIQPVEVAPGVWRSPDAVETGDGAVRCGGEQVFDHGCILAGGCDRHPPR